MVLGNGLQPSRDWGCALTQSVYLKLPGRDDGKSLGIFADLVYL